MENSFSTLQKYASCKLCPRECGVNRLAGQKGACGESSQLVIATMTAHFGEEPCITGTNGSGTVFFSGCSCGCFFCQNHQISRGERLGKIYDDEEFLEQLRLLVAQGVHNLNFVTPDHFAPTIFQACRKLREEGCRIPFLWNCSGYEKQEEIQEAASVIDVFLPDYKFVDGDLAEKCMGDRHYPVIALKAITTMIENKGFLRPWDDEGKITASTGVMVRHLVLPGQIRNSLQTLQVLHEAFGSRLPISLMSQFMPMPECRKREFLNQRLTETEFQQVVEYAEDLGFQKVFYQQGLGDDRFAPDFTKENPFPRQ